MLDAEGLKVVDVTDVATSRARRRRAVAVRRRARRLRRAHLRLRRGRASRGSRSSTSSARSSRGSTRRSTPTARSTTRRRQGRHDQRQRCSPTSPTARTGCASCSSPRPNDSRGLLRASAREPTPRADRDVQDARDRRWRSPRGSTATARSTRAATSSPSSAGAARGRSRCEEMQRLYLRDGKLYHRDERGPAMRLLLLLSLASLVSAQPRRHILRPQPAAADPTQLDRGRSGYRRRLNAALAADGAGLAVVVSDRIGNPLAVYRRPAPPTPTSSAPSRLPAPALSSATTARRSPREPCARSAASISPRASRTSRGRALRHREHQPRLRPRRPEPAAAPERNGNRLRHGDRDRPRRPAALPGRRDGRGWRRRRQVSAATTPMSSQRRRFPWRRFLRPPAAARPGGGVH